MTLLIFSHEIRCSFLWRLFNLSGSNPHCENGLQKSSLSKIRVLVDINRITTSWNGRGKRWLIIADRELIVPGLFYPHFVKWTFFALDKRWKQCWLNSWWCKQWGGVNSWFRLGSEYICVFKVRLVGRDMFRYWHFFSVWFPLINCSSSQRKLATGSHPELKC